MDDMEAAGTCPCAVCSDPQRRVLRCDRQTVARHALHYGTSPSKRARVDASSEEDKSMEVPVVDPCDEDASDEDVVEEQSTGTARTGPQRLQQFSKEILEFIGANDVNQTHVLKILRTVRAHFGPCSETGIVCPVTLWKLKKHAGYTASRGTTLLRLCAQDHPNPASNATCSTCTMPLNTRWPRRMVHIDLAERLSRLMSVAPVARAFMYAHDREPGDGDMWDGAQGRSISLQRRRDVFFIGLSSDATEFGHTKSASLTPFVALVLNFPPAMRTTFSAIMLLAVFPEKVRVRGCACARVCVRVRGMCVRMRACVDYFVCQPGDVCAQALTAVHGRRHWVHRV